MFNLEERDTQTKVKHEIIADYIIKWGSIITRGLKGHYYRNPKFRPTFQARFLYVDYFSFCGAYKENTATVYGSPVIGVKALDEIKTFFTTETAGLVPSVIAVLFEEDKRNFDQLIATLESLGYGARLKKTDNLLSLKDGDIAVINGDSSKYVDQVLKLIDAVTQTYSLHFIDPYGADGVERTHVERIVSKKGADCIINMMLNYFSRWMSVASKDPLNPTEQSHADAIDRFFGSDVWRDFDKKVKANIMTRQQAEIRLAAEFYKILRTADRELSVKQMPLKFQDRDQTLYNLFLTTHDPTGALTINEILFDARIREYDYRTEKRAMKVKPGQTDFFGLLSSAPDQKRPTEPEPDIDLLSDKIFEVCCGRRMQYREVLGEMVNSPYFLDDIRAAVGKLKEDGRANFDGTPSKITNVTYITFINCVSGNSTLH